MRMWKIYKNKDCKNNEKEYITMIKQKTNVGAKKEKGITIRRSVAKIGRNEKCPCGSGKKYKKCCLDKDMQRG